MSPKLKFYIFISLAILLWGMALLLFPEGSILYYIFISIALISFFIGGYFFVKLKVAFLFHSFKRLIEKLRSID